MLVFNKKRQDRIEKVKAAIEMKQIIAEKNAALKLKKVQSAVKELLLDEKLHDKYYDILKGITSDDYIVYVDKVTNAYVPNEPLTKTTIIDLIGDKVNGDKMIELLKVLKVIIGDNGRWLRWNTLDFISAKSGNPVGLYNQLLNKLIYVKSRFSIYYEVDKNGFITIHKKARYIPLTEEEKAAQRKIEADKEHRKRMGLPDNYNPTITKIIEEAEIEKARIKAERIVLIENVKPLLIAIAFFIFITWLIMGTHNVTYLE